MPSELKRDTCMFCGGSDYRLENTYTEPPPLEVRFAESDVPNYLRHLLMCATCGHFYSVHNLDLSRLYDGSYADANYAGDKLRKTFKRIVSLPPEESDNTWRVRRVTDYARKHLEQRNVVKTVLDVGSGLAVFPYAMKAEGWDIAALDPDARQSAHARDIAGVRTVHVNFIEFKTSEKFGLITFNKVLEHVEQPISMLRKARDFLAPGGLIYVELPDGEAAINDPDGPEREEFTIDHPHVFSACSMALLTKSAGFQVEVLYRIREPSGKYTMYMFLSAQRQKSYFNFFTVK